MMLVKPLLTNLKTTIRDDCAVSAHNTNSVYKSSHPLLVRGGGRVGLWTDVYHAPPTVAGIWNKATFSFHQPGLFIGFWVGSSWIPHTFSNTYTGQIHRNRMVGAGVWREGEWGVIVKGYRVSVWEDENILEMGDDDGWPTIGMYLIQLNLKPTDGKIYVMYITVI